LRGVASALLQQRGLRERFFPGVREPEWLMLLALADVGASLSVTALCYSSYAPYTTALRHIDRLERKGLVEREDHPSDERSVLVRLTIHAREKFDAFSERLEQREAA
jgi:DNA-binding MarR family transcriptional regulator